MGTRTGSEMDRNWKLETCNWRIFPNYDIIVISNVTIFTHWLGKETLNYVLIKSLVAVLFWLQGFNDVFPLKLLHLFDERELEVSCIRVRTVCSRVISSSGNVQGSASCVVYKTTTHSDGSKCGISCCTVLVDFWNSLLHKRWGIWNYNIILLGDLPKCCHWALVRRYMCI